MASIGHIEVEVKPTVTLESAEACVMMLNLFLDGNEDYRLEVGDDGKWHLTDEPLVPAMGGIRTPRSSDYGLPDVDGEANELFRKDGE